MCRLLLVALVGCAGADAAPATPSSTAVTAATQEIGIHPGEELSFEIRIGGILAGEAQLAVGEIGMIEGHRRVKIHSRAATAGAVAVVKHVVDEATTELDLETGQPVNFQTHVENGDKITTSVGKFIGKRAEIEYSRVDAGTGPVKYIIDFGTEEIHDAHSAMAAIRGWHAPVGATRTVFVLGGKRLWKVETTIAGTETIGTEMGNRPVVKLTGIAYRARPNKQIDLKAPKREFTVYLSDDADRVPLRVVGQTELGDVVMELVDYSRK